jgi:IS5 family transposase
MISDLSIDGSIDDPANHYAIRRFNPKNTFGIRRTSDCHHVSVAKAISAYTQLRHLGKLCTGLLHGEEREVIGDQAYWNESHRQTAKAVGIRYRINRRPNGRTPLSAYQRWINRRRSAARARVEHVLHVVKRLWGFSKVRYRGLAKNTARLYTSFAQSFPSGRSGGR